MVSIFTLFLLCISVASAHLTLELRERTPLAMHFRTALDVPPTSSSKHHRHCDLTEPQAPMLLSLLEFNRKSQRTLSQRSPLPEHKVFLDAMFKNMIQAHKDHTKASEASEVEAKKVIRASKQFDRLPLTKGGESALWAKIMNRWRQSWKSYLRIYDEALPAVREARERETKAFQSLITCKLLNREMMEYVQFLFQRQDAKAIYEERRKDALRPKLTLDAVLKSQQKDATALVQEYNLHMDAGGKSTNIPQRLVPKGLNLFETLTNLHLDQYRNAALNMSIQKQVKSASSNANKVNNSFRDLLEQLCESDQGMQTPGGRRFNMKQAFDRPGTSKRHDELEALDRQRSSSSWRISSSTEHSESTEYEPGWTRRTERASADSKQDTFRRRHLYRRRAARRDLIHYLGNDKQYTTRHMSFRLPTSLGNRSNETTKIDCKQDLLNQRNESSSILSLSSPFDRDGSSVAGQDLCNDGLISLKSAAMSPHRNSTRSLQERSLRGSTSSERSLDYSQDLKTTQNTLNYSQSSPKSSKISLEYSHSNSRPPESGDGPIESRQISPNADSRSSSPKSITLKQNSEKSHGTDIVREGLRSAFLKNAAYKLNSDREYFPDARAAIDLAAGRYRRAKKQLEQWSWKDSDHNLVFTQIHSANDKARWKAYLETYAKNRGRTNPKIDSLHNLMNFAMVNKEINQVVKDALNTRWAKEGIHKIKTQKAGLKMVIENLGEKANYLGHQLLFHKRQMKSFYRKELGFRATAVNYGYPASLKATFGPEALAAHAARAYYSFNRVKVIEDQMADLKDRLKRLGLVNRYTKAQVEKLWFFPTGEKRLVDFYPLGKLAKGG